MICSKVLFISCVIALTASYARSWSSRVLKCLCSFWANLSGWYRSNATFFALLQAFMRSLFAVAVVGRTRSY